MPAITPSLTGHIEWLGPETSAVTAAGSGRQEGRPDLLNPAVSTIGQSWEGARVILRIGRQIV